MKVIEMTEESFNDEIAVISVFNDDPSQLISKFPKIALFDQSSKSEIRNLIDIEYPNRIRVDNYGTSLPNYFSYIIENYNELPSRLFFLKSNVFPRHISEARFDQKLNLEGLIPFFNDENFKDKSRVAYHLIPGYFIERNNSWYMQEKLSKYFASYNNLLDYIFVKPIFPEYVLFAPGANYSTTKTSIQKYPLNFWKFCYFITSYNFFPPEAFLIERMLFTIFTSEYEIKLENFDELWFSKLNNIELSLKNMDKNGTYKKSNLKTKVFYSKVKNRIINKVIYELERRKLL